MIFWALLPVPDAKMAIFMGCMFFLGICCSINPNLPKIFFSYFQKKGNIPKVKPTIRMMNWYPKNNTKIFDDHHVNPYFSRSNQSVTSLLSHAVNIPVIAKVQKIKKRFLLFTFQCFFNLFNMSQRCIFLSSKNRKSIKRIKL